MADKTTIRSMDKFDEIFFIALACPNLMTLCRCGKIILQANYTSENGARENLQVNNMAGGVMATILAVSHQCALMRSVKQRLVNCEEFHCMNKGELSQYHLRGLTKTAKLIDLTGIHR